MPPRNSILYLNKKCLFLFHQFKFIPHKHYQNKNTWNSTFRRTKINFNNFFNSFSEMSQLLKLAKCHKKLVAKRAGSSNWEYHPEYRAGLWKKIVKTEIYSWRVIKSVITGNVVGLKFFKSLNRQLILQILIFMLFFNPTFS